MANLGTKLLYVQLTMDYTTNPQLTSVDGLKYVLGEGGATEPWATLAGLRADLVFRLVRLVQLGVRAGLWRP